MKKTLFSVLILLAYMCSAQTIEEKSMKSNILGCNKNYCIYLPAGYAEGNEQYPILYLLHGLTDNHTAWRDRGNIKEIATEIIDKGDAQKMIIVMPDAGTTHDGYFNCDGWRYEDFFFTEFIPHIETNYRVKRDRKHRAIAGLSMGGGGTIGYALRHSDMFSSAYAMSALAGMVENSWISRDTDTRRRLFMQSVVKHNNITFVENAGKELRDSIATVRWFIDVGDDDFLLENNFDFIKTLRKQFIPHQLRVRDGGHTWQYWQQALYIALPFISDGFEKE